MKKKLFTALLALCMAVALLTSTALAADFSDVDGHWGETAIERWADYGVLNGKGGGKFDPDGTMTRAEFAQMLVNMMGYTKTSTETFTDLDPNQWYAAAVSKLVAAGVMNGVGGGRVNPTGKITREEAAVMLCRAFDIKPSGSGSLSFADSGKVSSWAVDAMTALAERGMINGVGGNLLSPDGIVNRATAAQLTSNMVAKYVTTDTVISGETVNGVIIVAKGAKVEIKDSTVTAPIVAENAAVTLTNTKAANVKVEGSNASVTADSKSSVTDVVLAGSAPKADIKGSVSGGVTVAEGSTGVSATLPKGTTVANGSGSSVSVNGSTVASGTTATAPGTSSGGGGGGGIYVPSGGGGSGSGSGGNDHTTITPGTSAEEKEPAPAEPEDKPTQTEQDQETGRPEGGTTGGDNTQHTDENPDCAMVKDEEASVTASCTEFGKTVMVCSICGKTETTVSDKTAHTKASARNEDNSQDPTCGTAGYDSFDCAECGAENAFVVDKEATGRHTEGGWWFSGTKHGKQCTECGAWTTAKTDCTFAEQSVLTPNKDGTHTFKCVCGNVQTGNHTWNNGEVTKEPNCTETGVKTFTCTEEKCKRTYTEGINIVTDKHDWSNKDGVCKNNSEHVCDHGTTEAGKVCGTCGMTVPEKQPEEHQHTATEYELDGENKHHQVCTVNKEDGTVCGESFNSGDCVAQGNWIAENGMMVKKCVCSRVMEVCEHETLKDLKEGDGTDHIGTCVNCGVEEISEDCTAKDDTWTKDEEKDGYYKHCACGAAVGEACQHAGYDKEGTHKCKVCGAPHTGEQHVGNPENDNKCDVCGGTVEPTLDP